MPASDSIKIIMQKATTGARRLKPAKLASLSSPAPFSTSDTTPNAPMVVSPYVTA